MVHSHYQRAPFGFLPAKLAVSFCGLLLVCLLSACDVGGNTGATSPAQGGSTPGSLVAVSCSRASVTTVSQAIGIQVATPIENQTTTSVETLTFCIYKDAATKQTKEVDISYLTGPASQTFNANMQKIAPADQQPVSGLGDKAFFATRTFSLYVVKGNLFFTIGLAALSAKGGSKLLAEARQIATAILANS